MAINLASKYSDQIAEVFTRASFIKGKTAETYDLTGVKTLKVYTPITVEEVDYDRDGGLKRYGDVTEMQDVVQELTMTQDKAFTLTIDKGNNLDQNLVKNAADMLRLQLNEKSTPAADKYAFKRFVTMAGSIVESAKPTKANIISKIADASQALDDALVPDDNRYLNRKNRIPTSFSKLFNQFPVHFKGKRFNLVSVCGCFIRKQICFFLFMPHHHILHWIEGNKLFRKYRKPE